MVEDHGGITVEVAYAKPDEQLILRVEVAAAATIEEAIRQSKIMSRFPEIDLQVNKVGIFGKIARLNTTLGSGDRVEIYRALIADPKEIRRQRAAEEKRTRKAGGRRPD